MSKQNIHNLVNFLNSIDQKIFNEVKDLSSVDKNILNKFLSLKENLENFKIIISQIASETNQTYEVILNKFYKFKNLNLF